ncbi:hypothetical protein HYR99_19160 [Candidatus Poribacteria bacterium]|nr:hypothetical protein [Candidatus Poribacteria bacterium]
MQTSQSTLKKQRQNVLDSRKRWIESTGHQGDNFYRQDDRNIRSYDSGGQLQQRTIQFQEIKIEESG